MYFLTGVTVTVTKLPTKYVEEGRSKKDVVGLHRLPG